MKTDVTLHTAGNGYWSNVQKAVKVTRIACISYDPNFYADDREVKEEMWGELRVFFDTSTWDVGTDGLIYSDGLFLKELNEFLATKDMPAAEYSEQGMQGLNYVSLDVDGEFVVAWGFAGETVEV